MRVGQCNDIGTVAKTWIVVVRPIDIDVILQVDRSWKTEPCEGGRPDDYESVYRLVELLCRIVR